MASHLQTQGYRDNFTVISHETGRDQVAHRCRGAVLFLPDLRFHGNGGQAKIARLLYTYEPLDRGLFRVK